MGGEGAWASLRVQRVRVAGSRCVLESEMTGSADTLRKSIAGARPPHGPRALALDQAAMVHLGDGREGRAYGCSWERRLGASLLTGSIWSLKQRQSGAGCRGLRRKQRTVTQERERTGKHGWAALGIRAWLPWETRRRPLLSWAAFWAKLQLTLGLSYPGALGPLPISASGLGRAHL